LTSLTSTLKVVPEFWARQGKHSESTRPAIAACFMRWFLCELSDFNFATFCGHSFIREAPQKAQKSDLSLRCTSGGKGAPECGDLLRERFAVGPDGTILKVLLLPYRYGAFQGVDYPAASVEGSATMSRCDQD
jgi:hypothetical protein